MLKCWSFFHVYVHISVKVTTEFGISLKSVLSSGFYGELSFCIGTRFLLLDSIQGLVFSIWLDSIITVTALY